MSANWQFLFFSFYLHTPPLLPHCSSYPLLPLTLFCPRFPSWSGTRGHANFQQDQSVSLQEMFKICRKLLHRTNRQGPSFFLDKDLRSSCSNDMSVEPQRFLFWVEKSRNIFVYIAWQVRDKLTEQPRLMQINLSRVKTSRDVFDFGSERARKFVINKPDYRKPLVYSELFGVKNVFQSKKNAFVLSEQPRTLRQK